MYLANHTKRIKQFAFGLYANHFMKHFEYMDVIPDFLLYIGTDDKAHYCNRSVRNFSELLSCEIRLFLEKTFYKVDQERIRHAYLSAKVDRIPVNVGNVLCLAEDKNQHYLSLRMYPVTIRKRPYVLVIAHNEKMFQGYEEEEKKRYYSRFREMSEEIYLVLLQGVSLKDLVYYILGLIKEAVGTADFGAVLSLKNENAELVSILCYKDGKQAIVKDLENAFSMFKWTEHFEGVQIYNGSDEKNVKLPYVLKSVLKNYGLESLISATVRMDDGTPGIVVLGSGALKAFGSYDALAMEYFIQRLEHAVQVNQRFCSTIQSFQLDSMTGIYTRHFLKEVSQSLIPRWKRYNEQVCFVIADLNQMKAVNDTYGHLEGDRFIQSFSELMKNNFRSTDIFMRIGGDEFLLILYHTNAAEIHGKLGKANEEFAQNGIGLGMDRIKFSFSYGISEFEADSDDLDVLIQRADQEMYQFKKEYYKRCSGNR